MTTAHEPKKDELSKLSCLLTALERFRELHPQMTLHQAVAFLHVALDDGRSVSAYAAKIGVSHSVMSRHLLDIEQQNGKRDPGLGLVAGTACPTDLKVREYTL